MANRRKTQSKQQIKIIFALLAAILLLLLAYFRPDLYDKLLGKEPVVLDPEYPPQGDRSDEIPGKLQIHYIDVGQGDATLFITPDGHTALVDAGPGDHKEDLCTYLHDVGVKRLDMVFFTHPHEDHIGGGTSVLEEFEVSRVYLSDFVSNTSTFERLLLTMDEKGISPIVLYPGDKLSFFGCSVSVLGPVEPDDKNANNASLVLRFVYGSTSFLFSGDAEKEAENKVLAKYPFSLRSDVFQVGHHGSSTSNTEAFLKAISPSIAVISCELDNEYGHPHSEVVSALLSAGIKVYRTDLQGNILLLSDGKTVS